MSPSADTNPRRFRRSLRSSSGFAKNGLHDLFVGMISEVPVPDFLRVDDHTYMSRNENGNLVTHRIGKRSNYLLQAGVKPTGWTGPRSMKYNPEEDEDEDDDDDDDERDAESEEEEDEEEQGAYYVTRTGEKIPCDAEEKKDLESSAMTVVGSDIEEADPDAEEGHGAECSCGASDGEECGFAWSLGDPIRVRHSKSKDAQPTDVPIWDLHGMYYVEKWTKAGKPLLVREVTGNWDVFMNDTDNIGRCLHLSRGRCFT
jgi:hypothetical protein